MSLFLLIFLYFFSVSTRTLFVVTGPEVLRAGVPTSLAVTVLADFPGKVVAEVAHGNTKVVQTEEFHGGDATDRLIFRLFIMIFHFKATKYTVSHLFKVPLGW